LCKRASKHGYPCFLEVDGLKKGEPHDVVPMGMGKNKCILKAILGNQPIAEPPGAGTGIDDDDLIIFRSNFQTGCITSVF
jgi:hypothetical protein